APQPDRYLTATRAVEAYCARNADPAIAATAANRLDDNAGGFVPGPLRVANDFAVGLAGPASTTAAAADPDGHAARARSCRRDVPRNVQRPGATAAAKRLHDDTAGPDSPGDHIARQDRRHVAGAPAIATRATKADRS